MTDRTLRRGSGVAALLVLAAVLAGCSGGAAAGASPVVTTSVDLPKSYKFVPADIVVDAGATVTWSNHDDFTHNVTFGSDAALTMQPGASVTRSFPTAGTFDYLCSLHPNDMQGSVIVR
jgi:plastocyanin